MRGSSEDQGEIHANTARRVGGVGVRGPAKGQRTLAAVEDLARALTLALPAEQREQTNIAAQSPPEILRAAKNNQVKPLPVKGIRAHRLSEAHRQQWTELLQVFLEL